MSTLIYNLIKIDFADISAKNEFKRLTNTQVGGNEVLDIELIFPLPLITSVRDRWAWRVLNWGCSAMACEGEWMREKELSLIYDFTTYEQPPLGFISNIYLCSKIKRVHLTYIKEDKFIYLNDDWDGPCKKPNCSHNQCDIKMLEWTAEYDWSKRPHPLLEVDKTLRWIKKNFPQTDKREVGQIYHKLVSNLFFKDLPGQVAQSTRREFERQASHCSNQYVQAMVLLTDYQNTPNYVFKSGHAVIYDDMFNYYWKRSLPPQPVDPFPQRKGKSK